MAVVRTIYVLTIAAFLIMLVAFGISAFYEPPGRLYWESSREALKGYHQNVFFIAYPYGLLLILLGIVLRLRLDIISPGLLLGGIGAIIYAIAQNHLASEIRFAGVAIGLAVLLYAGHRMLLESKPATEAKT